MRSEFLSDPVSNSRTCHETGEIVVFTCLIVSGWLYLPTGPHQMRRMSQQ